VCEKSCSCCAKACGSCNGGCRKAFKAACDALGDVSAPITRNPLGSYVIGTWVAMVLVIAATGRTLDLIIDSADVSCDKPKIFCAVDIGLAFVHMVFAFYVQRRLVRAIGDKAAREVTHKEIAEKAQHVALYDVGFCIYMFILIGCFVYNCYTIHDLDGCVNTGGAWMGSAGMILYGVLVWNAGFCWFCTQCCGSQISDAREREAARPAAPATQAGGVGIA